MTIQELKEGIATWKLTRNRIIDLSVGGASILIYEFLARPIYRPYIYQNHINDFHLADTLGNTLGTIATIFVLIGLIGQGRRQHRFMITTITLSVVLYELAHPLLGKPIDVWDIVATVATGFGCYFGYNRLHPAGADDNQDVP